MLSCGIFTGVHSKSCILLKHSSQKHWQTGIKKKFYSHLHRVLVLIRLLIRVLWQEVPRRASVLSGVELPAPQGQRAVGEAQRERAQGLVDGIVVLLQVPVVVEVNDGVVVATHGVKLHIWRQMGKGDVSRLAGSDGVWRHEPPAVRWEGLTLVQRRRDGALDPGSVVVYHVDGEVGMPVGDDLHWTVTLCPL